MRAADAYHWLGDAELGDVGSPLEEVRGTAEQVLAEFETVRTLTGQAADALAGASERLTGLVRRLRGEVPRDAAGWVAGLTELRRAQGHLLTLKEMRYADTARIDEVAGEAEAELGAFGRRAVAFLGREDAFAGHHEVIGGLVAEAGELATVAQAAPLAARLDELTDGLRTVTEVIAGLDIGDATVRTSILERIAEVLGGVNRARATLVARRRELQDQEGRAEFAAEFALLGQAVTGALADAATPEACDTQLARLLVQVENLEARFTDFDDFLAELTGKRTEIHETFAARRQTLADERARRAEQLAASATRVLETVVRRAATLADADAVSTYFASDPLVTKIRRTVAQLRDLGDQVRAEELTGRLASAREEAARALRDRADLSTDGGRTLRLGRHRFTVNTEPLDLTLVPSGDGLAFALTGTDYRTPVRDPEFAATRRFWDRPLPSESPRVYRAEHLAARLLDEHGAPALAQEPDLAALVRRAAQESYDEGYERGVHDHDATAILAAVLRRYEGAGLLRHQPAARAEALEFWAHGTSPEERAAWTRRARSLARARDTFGPTPAVADFLTELAGHTGEPAAAYLFDELTTGPEGFVISAAARTLLDKFRRAVGSSAYDDDVRAVADLPARRQLVEAWLTAYTTASGTEADPGDLAEAVAAELCPDVPRHESDARLTETVGGLLGTHPRIAAGTLSLRIDELLGRTREFMTSEVPAHRAYQRRRTALVAAERARLRLDEYRPRVMSTFVRGRLVDEVYLPLVGDSLARQIGTTGEGRRTDTSGLLLLSSRRRGTARRPSWSTSPSGSGWCWSRSAGPRSGTASSPSTRPRRRTRPPARRWRRSTSRSRPATTCCSTSTTSSTPRPNSWRNSSRCAMRRGGWRACGRACRVHTTYGETVRRLHDRQPLHRVGRPVPGPRHARQPGRRLEPRRCPHRQGGGVRAELRRERADLQPGPRPAGRPRPRRPGPADPARGRRPSARADRLSYACDPAELGRVVAVLGHLLTARDTVLAVNSAYMASAGATDAARTEPPFRLQGRTAR